MSVTSGNICLGIAVNYNIAGRLGSEEELRSAVRSMAELLLPVPRARFGPGSHSAHLDNSAAPVWICSHRIINTGAEVARGPRR